MDHPDVKQHLDQLLQDPSIPSWIKRTMPELLELSPITAQWQVELLLDIMMWRTSQYFGPNAPHLAEVKKLDGKWKKWE